MNDVKRALFFWPAFTSALIILISLISPKGGESWKSVARKVHFQWSKFTDPGEVESRSKDLVLPMGNRFAWKRDGLAEVVSRPERGQAESVRDDAMDLFAATEQKNVPPQGNELTPDVLLQPPASDDTSTFQLSQDLLTGDFLAADRLAGRDFSLSPGRNPSLESDALCQIPSQLKVAIASDVQPTFQADSMPLPASPSQRELDPPAQPTTTSIAKPTIEIVQPVALPEEPTMPKSIQNLAKVVPRQSDATDDPADQPIVRDQSIEHDDARAKRNGSETTVRAAVSGNPSTWPLTPQLDDQLSKLTEVVDENAANLEPAFRDAVHRWSSEVHQATSQLRSLSRLGEKDAGEMIDTLDSLALAGARAANNMPVETAVDPSTARKIQIRWLQAVHAVNRRTRVWGPVWNVVSDGRSFVDHQFDGDNGQQVESLIRQLKIDIASTGDQQGWNDYLMLDQIADAATGDRMNDRFLTAQKVNSRIRWHGLSDSHRQWMDRDSVRQLIVALQPWIRKPVDYAALLNQIERQESNAIDLAAIDIAGAAQTLRFSDHEGTMRVAAAIDTCYRNANIRTAISQEMLRRLIPDVAPTTVPVRTTLLGSRVKGVSRINSELDLALRPSSTSWRFALQTAGQVQTQSVGRKGSASIRTRGQSQFDAMTPIEITPNGVLLSDSQLDVRGNTRLRGVASNYDGWPLLGSLARSVIAARYQERAGLASRIANRRMSNQLGEGIDQRLEAKINQASNRLEDVVMGPLNSLKLQPKVIDMQTTDERLIARYRLAGDWQIGSSTPRPRAPSDSFVSVQINQSAINNTLEQVVPLGESTSLQMAFDNTMKVFGRPQVALPDDIPDDVLIQFAKSRPITVELEDGMLWITMRVVELSRSKGSGLSRFIVRAGYRPQVDGLRISLVREGHLRISGPGMSMRQRLPIRAVFNRVFSPNHSIPITNESFVNARSLADTEISQLELRDGWFALAIGPQRPDRIAVGTRTQK